MGGFYGRTLEDLLGVFCSAVHVFLDDVYAFVRKNRLGALTRTFLLTLSKSLCSLMPATVLCLHLCNMFKGKEHSQ